MSESAGNRGALSVKTLAVASAASALATYLVPMIWRPGTIAAAAATPVIVALISEALSRPAERVSQAGRLVRVPRSRLRDRGRHALSQPRVRLALVTGVLGFLVAAVVITTTELATGRAVSSDQRTTLLGGENSSSSEQPSAEDDGPAPAATATPAAPAATGTPEGETGAQPSPSPEAGATPAPVAPEATPTPAPGSAPTATPAPAAP